MSRSTPIGEIGRRQIGPWGTTARAAIGALLLAVAAVDHPTWIEVLLGLVVVPAGVTSALTTRGTSAPPLRLHSMWAHAANVGLAVIFVAIQPTVAALFYGSAMLLAAWRGMGSCEVFVVSNLIRGRDDQLGCPLFLCVDLAESRRAC